jgi:hypothetical protein
MYCYALRHLPYDLDRTSSTIIKLHVDAASPSDARLPRLAFCADAACFRATSSASCYRYRLRVVQYWLSSPQQGLPLARTALLVDLHKRGFARVEGETNDPRIGESLLLLPCKSGSRHRNAHMHPTCRSRRRSTMSTTSSC